MFEVARLRCVVGVIAVGLGACGDDGGSSTQRDAAVDGSAMTDAAVDASIDAPSGLGITCPAPPTQGQLTSLRIAMTGLTVLWHNADGTLRACTQTDATGKAEAYLEATSSVTWVVTGNTTLLVSYLGVQPGENLVFSTPPSGTTPQVRVTYTGAVTNADGYMFDLGCGGSSYAGTSGFSNSLTPADASYFPSCVSTNNQLNIYAEARNASVNQFEPTAYAVATNVALTPPLTQVQLGAWRTDFVTASVTLSNMPYAVQSTGVYLGWTTDGVDFNDRFYRLDGNAVAAGGSATLTGRKLPMAFADAMLAEIWLTNADGNILFDYRESSGAVGNRTFDMSGSPGFVTNVTENFSSTMPRPTISWQADSTLQGGDLVQIQLRYDPFRWALFMAPTQLSVQLPELPDTLAAARPYNPFDSRVIYYLLDDRTGYDNVRASTPPIPSQMRGRISQTFF